MVARFFCRHPQTIAFGWKINGTALTLINPRPPEIKDGSVLLSDGMGGAVSTEALNITALPNYNATEVVCVAFLSNGTQDFSSPAILTVQGEIIATIKTCQYDEKVQCNKLQAQLMVLAH